MKHALAAVLAATLFSAAPALAAGCDVRTISAITMSSFGEVEVVIPSTAKPGDKLVFFSLKLNETVKTARADQTRTGETGAAFVVTGENGQSERYTTGTESETGPCKAMALAKRTT